MSNITLTWDSLKDMTKDLNAAAVRELRVAAELLAGNEVSRKDVEDKLRQRADELEGKQNG